MISQDCAPSSLSLVCLCGDGQRPYTLPGTCRTYCRSCGREVEAGQGGGEADAQSASIELKKC